MSKSLYFALLVAASFFVACGNAGKMDPTAGLPQDPNGAENFAAFRDKFLSDTAFQMTRISFPLEGLPEISDSIGQAQGADFRWTRQNWKPHQPLDESDKNVTVQMIDLGSIKNEVMKIDGGFAVERRFSLGGDNKWYLIYYSGVQMITE